MRKSKLWSKLRISEALTAVVLAFSLASSAYADKRSSQSSTPLFSDASHDSADFGQGSSNS